MKNPLQSLIHVGLLLHNLNKESERKSGLSLVQWSILSQLMSMPAVSAQVLSEKVKLHPSTLTQTLKRLIRKKWIFVSEDPRDSRKKMISLTREGKLALDRSAEHISRLTTALTLMKGELSQLESCLAKLLTPSLERDHLDL